MRTWGGSRVKAAPDARALDAELVVEAARDPSGLRASRPGDDTLLTLDQARAALLGDAAAERSNAWPSIKTLRRAYASGELAVVQRVAGGRLMVWRSELLRWAFAPPLCQARVRRCTSRIAELAGETGS